MRIFFLILCLTGFYSCKENSSVNEGKSTLWSPYNDSLEVAENAHHEKERMRYKLIQSNFLDKNTVFRPLHREVLKFTKEDYNRLRPLILEQNIPTIHSYIDSGKLSYEELVQFYLYRIYTYELDNAATLHTVIALNTDVLKQARVLDSLKTAGVNIENKHPVYGMPILLKDNINTAGMVTTAGAIAFKNNVVDDSFVVQRLKERGALILGKVNLSEWAYFLCKGCPVGYSAYGGQTLNPYGRKVFETGGSSSGSGTAVAVNYAVGAVGTETSGSILSPSSQNSIVGLKPTIGIFSRAGIVPISSTLDTPGPMTKNVIDNAILASAMLGKDFNDAVSVTIKDDFLEAVQKPRPLSEMRLGAISNLMQTDSIYKNNVDKLRELGAQVVEFTPPNVNMQGFISLLNVDMKHDFQKYTQQYTTAENVPTRTIADVVAFNKIDATRKIPYGQDLFMGILKDSTSFQELAEIKIRLQNNGRHFFDEAMNAYELDAVLSINNYHAGYAAVAKYPALTVPMGYKLSGEPTGITFIGKQYSEANLYQIASAFEQATKFRKIPILYER